MAGRKEGERKEDSERKEKRREGNAITGNREGQDRGRELKENGEQDRNGKNSEEWKQVEDKEIME